MKQSVCLDFLYHSCPTCFPTPRRIQRDIAVYVRTSSCKAPVFLSDFNETWIFSTDFRKILKYQISRKFVQWEPNSSMRRDRQTDMTKLIFAFLNSAKAHAPKSHQYFGVLEKSVLKTVCHKVITTCIWPGTPTCTKHSALLMEVEGFLLQGYLCTKLHGVTDQTATSIFIR